jgi:hypothetical protein
MWDDVSSLQGIVAFSQHKEFHTGHEHDVSNCEKTHTTTHIWASGGVQRYYNPQKKLRAHTTCKESSPGGDLAGYNPQKRPQAFFSRMRVQLAAAIAKAAAARFVQDDVDDDLPIHTLYEQKVAGQTLDLPDLPLYHVPS